MVAFRRVITALAVLALFVGLASAQVNTGGAGTQLTCATNVTVTPALRGEGYTEQTGDITITCSGGVQPAVGATIPLVNITVFYNTNVTSRLLTGSISTSSPNPNEALLLIDEPNSGLPGEGPARPQVLCTTPLTGCAAYANMIPTVATTPAGTVLAAVTAVGGTTPAPNVYQGTTSCASSSNCQTNAVTFFGIPVLPPTSTGSRVYRITNVRVNAQPLAGGSASGANPVQANISISGATSLSISQSNPNVGYVSYGLTAGASGPTGLNQCSSQTKTPVSILTFSENFGTAFKTRVAAQSTSAYAGQINNPAQNIPGAIYNSESNFVFPAATFGNNQAGLADYGTRLKAVFNNIPANARIFVSTANVNNAAFPILPTAGALSCGPIGGSGCNVNTTGVSYAQLVSTGSTEAINDGNAGISGFFPAVNSSDNGPNGGNVPIAEVTLNNGTGSAVWEVVNTNPNTNESLKFAVYITYSAAVAQNSPAAGTSTVSLSYAPTATSGVASNSLSIPRFVPDTNPTPRSIFTINICRTILLYPFITHQNGFDTGITVANTSLDPFTVGGNTTLQQNGSCTLNYYGGTTAAPLVPPSPGTTGNINGGTVWAGLISTIAPNFQGYMFAVCNFQYAHGFAFISDFGARNLAMGYLAIVIPDPGTGTRNATPACQGISNCSTTGEQDAH